MNVLLIYGGVGFTELILVVFLDLLLSRIEIMLFKKRCSTQRIKLIW